MISKCIYNGREIRLKFEGQVELAKRLIFRSHG